MAGSGKSRNNTVRGAFSFSIDEKKKPNHGGTGTSRGGEVKVNGGGGASRYGSVAGLVAGATPILPNTDTYGATPTVVKDLVGGWMKDVVSAKDKPNAPSNDNGYSSASAYFVPSQSYMKAMEYTQSLLDQLSSGRTSYTDKVNSMLKSIEDKEPFSYDPNSDTLFQNYLNGMMQSGQLAMQDTMGQAAALTGGYGSTYAQAVGNQAYNNMVQGAYEQLPEYYGLARDAYDKELQGMYNKLDMYSTQDQLEYDRLANAYGLNAQANALQYDNEYNNFWQSKNFNEDSRRWAAEMGLKAQQYADNKEQWQKEYEMALGKSEQKASEGAPFKALDTNAKAMLKGFVEKEPEALDDNNSDKHYELWDYVQYLENMGYDYEEIKYYIDSIAPQQKRGFLGLY